MPRTNINYSNTIIYKLCCKDLSITEIYVGSTTDFRKRRWLHKSNCNNEKSKNYNVNVYQFIRENKGWDIWDMIEIERFEAIDGNDARKRERYWVETLKATLNMQLPSRTNKEWCENNKETLAEKKKKYHETHKENIAEKKKEWYENNKEILAEYYINNKEIINEKAKEKTKCECGCEITKRGLNRHKQTKKHIELMSQKVLSNTVVN